MLLFVFLLTGVPCLAEPAETWWLRITFQPRGLEILGIPVASIDHGWVAASPLTERDLPPEAHEPGLRMEDTALRFSIEGDFDRDGRTDTALAGVYRARSGDAGRFLLVASQKPDGAWEKRAVFSEPGSPGFGALTYDQGEIRWWDCMLCGYYQTVIPEAGTFKIDPFGAP